MPAIRLFDTSNTEYSFSLGIVAFYKYNTLVDDMGCNGLFTRVSDAGNNYSVGTSGSYFGYDGWYESDPFDKTNGTKYTPMRAGGVEDLYSSGTSLKSMVQTAAGSGQKTLYTHQNGAGTPFLFDGTVSGAYSLTVGSGGDAITITQKDAASSTIIVNPTLCAFANNSDLPNIPGYGANVGFYLVTYAEGTGYKLGAFSYGTLISDVEYESEPGEKGFEPTAANTNINFPGVGGRGFTNKRHPDYASDTITQPTAPDESSASAVRSGFLNVYQISESELNKICGVLYSDTLLNAIQSVFVNPLDFIVSLQIFPLAANVGSAENLKFGKWIAAATGATALGTAISANKLSSQFKTIDFGTINIPENWGNFLDYSQTTIELYLPFIGSVNIDVSECMGGTINVQYTIDFITGMCVANVLCTRHFNLPSNKLVPNRAQHAFQGNCSIQIPLSAVNYGNMVGSLINACTQGITNPVGGFMGMAQDAVTGGIRPNVSSKGNIVANAGFCSVLYPYVRITRPITAEPDSYQEVMGLPSYINTTLGQCDDLCICDGINLQNVSGATENELNKIRQMCMDGVYV